MSVIHTNVLAAYGAIIEGFKVDCAKLLKSFVESGKHDFDTFVGIWQNMKFSLIFCNYSLPELKLYTDHIFLVVKNYLTADNFSTLGPFYLLYALYYKQPTKSALIRITKEELESLMALTRKYAKDGYYAPAYMLAKLQLEKAFYYTADSQIFAMDNRFEKKFNSTCDFKKGAEVQTDFEKSVVIDSGWYKKWKAVEDKYNQLKSELFKDEENNVKKTTNPNISRNPISAPIDLLKEFKINITDRDKAEQKEKTDKSETASDSIGKTRMNLKRRIFEASVVFNKYDKKDDVCATAEATNVQTVKMEKSNFPPAVSKKPQILKNVPVGKWKHYLKDAINHGKQYQREQQQLQEQQKQQEQKQQQ